jgi:hypothetical protein
LPSAPRHVGHEPAGEARGTVRDALTHFDECGIVVLSSQPELLDLLRGFSLAGSCSSSVVPRSKNAMRFVIFGHATYEAIAQALSRPDRQGRAL